MSCIISQSGRLIDVMNPRPEDITIEDIAAGLVIGKTERYGSRTKGRYYVAEHSVHVANLLARRLQDDATFELDSRERLVKAALLHDAAEAYLGDIVQPLKCCLPDYKELEHKWEIAIANKFWIHPSLLSCGPVKQADQDIFQCELVSVAADVSELYGVERHKLMFRYANLIQELPALKDMGWSAERARLEFLDLCNILNIK